MKTKTDEQTAFDIAKHGWAFASGDSLEWRVNLCGEIAQRLSPADERHETLKTMRQELAKKGGES